MRPFCLSLSLALCAGAAAAAPLDDSAAKFTALQALEGRVAAVAWRITSANADLCPAKGPQTGLTLHEAQQYAPESRVEAVRFFHLVDAPAVMAVAPGSPAQQAGLRVGDAITALNGVSMRNGAAGPESYDGVRRALAAIDAALQQGPVVLTVSRGAGRPERLTLRPTIGCDYEVQLIPSPKMEASADGQVVSVSTALARYAATDDELAVVIGHEMAHNVLQHSQNRTGSQRNRERAADYVGLYLTARAGYDVTVAEGFWRRFGDDNWRARLGIITHPSPTARSKAVAHAAEEIARKGAAGEPLVPEPL